MVEIQCPHCEEDIELKHGSTGLFNCPYCHEEFSYEGDDIFMPTFSDKLQIFMTVGMKIGLAIVGLGVVLFLGFLIDEGPNCTEFGCGMWIYIPCGIWAIGIPIVVISFLRRVWQLNQEA